TLSLQGITRSRTVRKETRRTRRSSWISSNYITVNNMNNIFCLHEYVGHDHERISGQITCVEKDGEIQQPVDEPVDDDVIVVDTQEEVVEQQDENEIQEHEQRELEGEEHVEEKEFEEE